MRLRASASASSGLAIWLSSSAMRARSWDFSASLRLAQFLFRSALSSRRRRMNSGTVSAGILYLRRLDLVDGFGGQLGGVSRLKGHLTIAQTNPTTATNPPAAPSSTP